MFIIPQCGNAAINNEEKVRGMFDTVLTCMIDGDKVIDIPYQIERLNWEKEGS